MDDLAVISHLLDILGEDVLTTEELMAEIIHADFPLRRMLMQRFRNKYSLEKFLNKYNRSFIVENARVAAFDPSLENGRQNAVPYFENELDLYDENPLYLNFRGHIGQAGENVKNFIKSFYPDREFKNFLLSHPEVFIMFDDDTVDLIQSISVDYFEDILDTYEEGVHFKHLRGHIGQAEAHVIDYINNYYPGDHFLEFLENNSDVFRIEGGYVYLNEDN